MEIQKEVLIKNVDFCYRENTKKSLENISLSVESGECVLLCGKSGCGKSTLLKMINGIIPHLEAGEQTGVVEIHGEAVGEIPMYQLARRISTVFQNPKSQFFNVEPISEIIFALENRGAVESEIDRVLKETVEELGIEKLMAKTVFGMSGGEKQIIAFASAYAARSKVLVLDEPSANLDQSATAAILQIMLKMKAAGTTVLIAEHRIAWLKEALVIKDITLAYGKKTIIREFSFSANRGEVTATVGSNGTGKTSLSRCLCGLHNEKAGSIILAGIKLSAKKRRKSGYLVMQDVNHQLFAESVLEECLLSKPERDLKEVKAILEDFDLWAVSDHHPQALSGGQKQRLAIVSALLEDKEFYILDEPTSGLDYESMLMVCFYLKKLADIGKIVIVITHDLELVQEGCDKVINMEL